MKKAILHRSLSPLCMSLTLFACEGVQSVSGDKISTDSGSFSMSSVCFKDSIALAGFNRAKIGIVGNARIGGDVFVAERCNLQVAGNPTVNGTIYVDDDGAASLAGNASVSGGIVHRDLQVEDSLLQDFGKNLSSLKSTQDVDSISSSMTLQGRGGLNVIQIKGDLQLVGQEKLTLNGTEKDIFILNVYGGIQLAGQAQVAVAGTVKPQNVLIHAVGTGSDLELAGNAALAGSYFAESRGAHLAGNMKLNGAVVATNSIQIAGNGVQLSPRPFCIDVSSDDNGDNGNPSPSPSPSSTGTPSPSPSPTDTGTPSPSPTPSPTDTGTPAPSPSPDPSASPSPSPSPMPCTSLVCGGGTIGV